jgi:hypothetical protein
MTQVNLFVKRFFRNENSDLNVTPYKYGYIRNIRRVLDTKKKGAINETLFSVYHAFDDQYSLWTGS